MGSENATIPTCYRINRKTIKRLLGFTRNGCKVRFLPLTWDLNIRVSLQEYSTEIKSRRDSFPHCLSVDIRDFTCFFYGVREHQCGLRLIEIRQILKTIRLIVERFHCFNFYIPPFGEKMILKINDSVYPSSVRASDDSVRPTGPATLTARRCNAA